jgi:hypothetical protein
VILDQLEVLDDATPPTPDAALLARVREQANRRRRRNRFTAAGVCIVSFAVVVGTLAVVHDDGRKVDVIRLSPSTTTPPSTPKPVREGTLPNGLHVRMTLDTPRVVLGNQIRAKVQVRNNTAKPQSIGVGSLQCSAHVGPVLRDSRGIVVADAIHGVACYLPARAITIGQTISFTTTLSTNSLVIPRGQHSRRFELGLEPVETRGLVIWRLAPIAVDVVAPSVTGRIELPTRTFTAGDEAKGTLVIDNKSAAPIPYGVGCPHDQPWRVWLSKDGVVFSIPETVPLCRSKDAPTEAYAVGTTRLPFSVWLHYPSCGPVGNARNGSPDCVDGAIPPLPGGRYQVVFEGRGPLGSVEVAPVPIRVVAAPLK